MKRFTRVQDVQFNFVTSASFWWQYPLVFMSQLNRYTRVQNSYWYFSFSPFLNVKFFTRLLKVQLILRYLVFLFFKHQMIYLRSKDCFFKCQLGSFYLNYLLCLAQINIPWCGGLVVRVPAARSHVPWVRFSARGLPTVWSEGRQIAL